MKQAKVNVYGIEIMFNLSFKPKDEKEINDVIKSIDSLTDCEVVEVRKHRDGSLCHIFSKKTMRDYIKSDNIKSIEQSLYRILQIYDIIPEIGKN